MASGHPCLSAEKNHNDLYHIRVKRDKEDLVVVTNEYTWAMMDDNCAENSDRATEISA